MVEKLTNTFLLMSPLDNFRLSILQHIVDTKSFSDGWAVWEPLIRQHCGGDNPAESIFEMGEHLSDIFRGNKIEGRSQSSVSGGGNAWECLITWYLNLVFWGTDVIATRQNKKFVPNVINNALTVTIANQPTNTESDVLAYRIPHPNTNESLTIAKINDIVTNNLQGTDVAIVQCKTNWNDNAQIPMLWDLIYNSKEFRIPNVSVGIKGVNPTSFRRFAYAFMTVPTSKGTFKPTALAVLRVKNITGGNYWGQKSKVGVSSCINEFFLRNFPDVFTGGVIQHIKTQITNPAVLEAFLSLNFDTLKQQPVAG